MNMIERTLAIYQDVVRGVYAEAEAVDALTSVGKLIDRADVCGLSHAELDSLYNGLLWLVGYQAAKSECHE